MKTTQTGSLSAVLRARATEQGRALYMPYFTLGDPDFDMSLLLAEAMIRGGADVLELGIPFSDPTADGPIIQKAMVRAMSGAGFSLDRIFEVTAEIHRLDQSIPLVYLTYLNPVLSCVSGERKPGDSAEKGTGSAGRGSRPEEENARRFFERAGEAGIRGLVIPDLPHDSREAGFLRQIGDQHGIDIVGMIAPNTSEKRLHEICRTAAGFIYYVTSQGVTGERSSLPADLAERLEKVRALSSVPVFAGFGISRPDQAALLVGHTDGVIAGSVHHRMIEEDPASAPARIEELTRKFTEALRIH